MSSCHTEYVNQLQARMLKTTIARVYFFLYIMQNIMQFGPSFSIYFPDKQLWYSYYMWVIHMVWNYKMNNINLIQLSGPAVQR